MKKLIVAAILIASISTFAQKSKDANSKPGKEMKGMRSPEEMADARVKKLTKELGLDANQQVSIKKFLLETNDQKESVNRDRMDEKYGQSPTSKADREAMKQKRTANKEMMETKLKGILSPAQYDKYVSIQEMNKDKLKDGRK